MTLLCAYPVCYRDEVATPYDAIIIGTGAGGGTLALHLAQTGKRILILERGPFMPQEKLNWDTSAVFLDNRYHTKEILSLIHI